MKKLILLILILAADFQVKAQQNYWPSAIAPASSSFSPTFRWIPGATDSLNDFTFAIGTKSYRFYSSARANSLFIQKSNGSITVADTTALKTLVRGGVITQSFITDLKTAGNFKWFASGYTANGGTVFTATGGGYWVRQFTGNIQAEWFGAKGDGTTPDQVAIQSAIDYATTLGLTVKCRDGVTYRLTAGIIVTCDFDFYTSTFSVPSSTVPIAILVQANKTTNTSALLSLKTIRLPYMINSTAPGTGWAGQGKAIVINNAFKCPLIQTNVVIGFDVGVYITANVGAAGNSNNTYRIGSCLSNNYNLVLQPRDNGAYINENTFYGDGGQLGYYGSNPHGTISLDLRGNTINGLDGPNGNRFYNFDFEGDMTVGSSPDYVIGLAGLSNVFVNCRYEFSNANGRLIFHNLVAPVTDNHFEGGYSFGNLFTTTLEGSQSTAGTIFKDIGRAISTKNTYGEFINNPQGGSGVIKRVYAGAKNLALATIADTDWLIQETSGGNLQVKSGPFDTYASVQLAPRIIQFGDGSFNIASGPFLAYTGTNSVGTTTSFLQAGTTAAYNTAYLKVGGSFGVWQDGTFLRYKNGTPASATDGTPIGLSTPIAPIVYNAVTSVLSMPAATNSVDGYLSSTDRTAFNAKQTALSGTGYSKWAGTSVSYNATIPNADLTNSTISGISLGSNLNALTFSSGGAGDASGTTYTGAAARTISYNSVGAAPLSSVYWSRASTTLSPVNAGDAISVGAITGTYLKLNTLNEGIWMNATTGTGTMYMKLSNNGGNSYFGLSNSAGGGLFGGGAYSLSLGTEGAVPLVLATNNTARLTISSSGVIAISTAPSTSAVTYDFLTRNTSTGAIEKIASSSFATLLTSFYSDVTSTTAAADAYSYTVAANSLTTNGQYLDCVYTALQTGGDINTIIITFGGQTVYNNSANNLLTGTDPIGFKILRSGTTTARCQIYYLTTSGSVSYSTQDLTGVDFTTTNIIKASISSATAGTLTMKSGTITIYK
jgi:hypothetical protein